jgi:CrcB protein
MDKSAILFIALGGAIGSVLRVWLSMRISTGEIHSFPYGTFSINVIGSFIIGALMAYSDAGFLANSLKYLLVAGFCGGFTTFSTFSFETIRLIRIGNYQLACIYTFGSMLLCLLSTALAYYLFSGAKK